MKQHSIAAKQAGREICLAATALGGTPCVLEGRVRESLPRRTPFEYSRRATQDKVNHFAYLLRSYLFSYFMRISSCLIPARASKPPDRMISASLPTSRK